MTPRYAVGDKIWFAHYNMDLFQENIHGEVLGIDETRPRGDIYDVEVWYPVGGRRHRRWASPHRILGLRSDAAKE